MAIRRIHKKIERTPEQLAELHATRAAFQAEKPSLDELLASGDYTEPVRHGNVMDPTKQAAPESEREKLRFVCNLPGIEPGLTEVIRDGLSAGGEIGPGGTSEVLVDRDPTWRTIGANVVGPPHGENPEPGDVGIYESPRSEDGARHVAGVSDFLGLTPGERAEVERRLRASPTRSRSEVRRVAFMVEGERKAKGEEPR